MNARRWIPLAILLAACAAAPRQKENLMHATGPFEVKLTPQTPEPDEDAQIARILIDKQFHGDLEATSKVHMLAFQSAVKGSAGYVALEKVTGRLHGKSGTFVLQHSGTMNRGAQELALTVVPDSGTGELEGLSGTMAIDIEGGKHSYRFDYSLGL